MATAYTSLLGLALPVTGELSGTWGSTVNTEITALLDSAIAGTTTLSTDADVTLTTTTGAANTSRQAILLCSGARTVLRTITAPAQSKIYTIINATTGGFSVKLVGAGPTTGVTVVAGESAVCAWNGSDFIKISNTAGVGTFTNLTVTGTLGVTGVATLGNGAVLGTPASGTVTNLTGTASININGTVGATTASTGAFTTLTSNGATTFTAGTASTSTTTGTTVITGGLGVSGRINAANFDGIVGANTAAAGAFTTLSATGVATFSAGSAAAPAITTTGDTNTGIFFPAADTIAFAEGGAESARIDSSGNFGLGVTPSAWQSSWAAFQLGNRSLARSNAGAGDLTMVFNGYFDATDSRWEFQNSGDYAARYSITGSGIHSWHTSTGTGGAADAPITFTQAMTLDASGNLGLGATSITPRDSGARTLELYGTSSGRAAIKFTNSTSGTGATDGMFLGYDDQLNFTLNNNEAGYISFATSNTERARIDTSGNLLVGTTSQDSGAKFTLNHAGQVGQVYVNTGTANAGVVYFKNDNGVVGQISTSGSATTYATSSDYRLKNTVAPMTGALDKVALLKPCTYKWNVDGSDGQGFIAHELAEVEPGCVTGTKDAVDAEGKPQYQGIDTSFLVATLTAAIQEQQILITQLTTRITALEGA